MVHLTMRMPHHCVLQDLENSTGSWDMYGQDSDKRYPGMQVEFFERAGDVLKRREALRGFVALGELGGSWLVWQRICICCGIASGQGRGC
jgi:hypothetical protein